MSVDSTPAVSRAATARQPRERTRLSYQVRAREKLIYPLLLLLFSLLAIRPAFEGGYWWGAHDARHAVYFLFEFDQAIRDGILWPRWAPNFAFGFGYPFFNIYGPLSSYVGQGFHLLGADLVGAVRLSFASSILLSGLAMYAFTRRIFGANAGLVASVAYVYLPYHLADVYVRAALAESWAFVFFPLVFWGFYECVTRPRARAVALAAVAYALLFLAHNGLALQLTLVLVGWILFWLLLPLREEGRIFWREWPALRPRLLGALAAAAAGVLGIALAGIFVLPWLLEARFVNTEQWFAGYYSFTHHFVEFWQLLSPYWGYGTSEAGPDDTFPFQLGLVPLLFAVASWALPLRDRPARYARLFFTLMLAYFVVLMLEPSRFVWESPFGELILKPMQFPWRFLVLAGFALAVLAGILARRAPLWATILYCMILVGASLPYARAEMISPTEGPVSHAGLMRFQSSAGELTGQSSCVAEEDIPIWSDLADVWISGKEVTSRFAYGDLPEGAWAGNAVGNSIQEITELRLHAPAQVRWMITYYPGWRVYRLPLEGDGFIEEVEIQPAPRSCHITVLAPEGHYRLMVRFEDTPVRVVGRWLSIISMVVIGLILVWDRRSQYEQ
jgi:hypothetical protein